MVTQTTPSADGPAARVIEVADRLFYEQGFAATGINQLIAEANVAKASFYQHFPSKVHLAVTYLQQRKAAMAADMKDTVEQQSSPRHRVFAVFDYVASWLEDHGFRGCAFQNAVAEFPDVDAPPRQVVREAKDAIRTYLTELCTDAGHPDAGDEVFLLLEGATSQAAITKDRWPMAAARRAVERRIR